MEILPPVSEQTKLLEVLGVDTTNLANNFAFPHGNLRAQSATSHSGVVAFWCGV